VPEWSDELAKRISQGQFETILELRMDVRQKLQQSAKDLADRRLALKALDRLVERATINYPEEFIQDYITDLLAEIGQNLARQQGLTLKDYLRITGQTEDDLRQRYRETAARRAERALVMAELVHREQIDASDEDIDAEIDRLVASLGGEQSAQFRKLLSTQQSRSNIGADLIASRAIQRLVAIAKGENPPVGIAQAEPVETQAGGEPAQADEVADEVTPVTDSPASAETTPPTAEAATSGPVEDTGETDVTG